MRWHFGGVLEHGGVGKAVGEGSRLGSNKIAG